MRLSVENVCRMNKYIIEGLQEPLTSSKLDDTVVVPVSPGIPLMVVSETYPMMGSNPVVSKAECTTSELLSSQQDDTLNAHEIGAILEELTTQHSVNEPQSELIKYSKSTAVLNPYLTKK